MLPDATQNRTAAQESPWLDLLAALILVAGIGAIVSWSWSSPPFEPIADPEGALSLLVSRSMDLEESLDDVSDWERLLFETISGETADWDEVIAWYEELGRHSHDGVIQIRLGILEGEAGELEDLEARLGQWTAPADPLPLYGRLLEAAYLDRRITPAEASRLLAELAEILPPGWFQDRLALRLAERTDDHELSDRTQAGADLREEILLARARGFLLLELLIVALGAGALAVVFVPRLRDPSRVRIGWASVPPRWSGRAGTLVLLRGGAAGILVIVAFTLWGTEGALSQLVMVPLFHAPLLWLAVHHLFRPNGLGFADGLGLRPEQGRGGRLVLAVAALSAAGLMVDWVIAWLAEPLGLSMHWTDWFDPALVWGSAAQAGLTLIDYLVFAPIFEEIVFRGLLFGTLRRRLPFLPAALLSALLFSLAHGYGLLGLVSIGASGMIWAWAYERTGSLLPGMLAHSVNNLLFCLGLMLMLR